MNDKVSDFIAELEGLVSAAKKARDDRWCVLDFDGNPMPGRWATEEEAFLHGYTGRYLLSGCAVARLDVTGAVEYEV